jgi:hypothetical protein
LLFSHRSALRAPLPDLAGGQPPLPPERVPGRLQSVGIYHRPRRRPGKSKTAVVGGVATEKRPSRAKGSVENEIIQNLKFWCVLNPALCIQPFLKENKKEKVSGILCCLEDPSGFASLPKRCTRAAVGGIRMPAWCGRETESQETNPF